MAGSVVRTGSEPEPDLIGTEPQVRFQVQPSEPDLSPVRGSNFSIKKPNGTGLRQH